jgi:Rrf2 family protein
MRMSDGVEWGVHVCTLLAGLPDDAALPAAKLAEYHGVPAAYLAKHLQALAGAGVLRTVKGAKGGYRLAKPPAQITAGALLRAVEGQPGVGAVGRAARGSAGDAGGDLIHLWRAVSEAVDSVVDGTTLEDLKRQAVERRASTKPMYHI